MGERRIDRVQIRPEPRDDHDPVGVQAGAARSAEPCRVDGRCRARVGLLAAILTHTSHPKMIRANAAWCLRTAVGGYSELPDGVAQLWHALVDDLA